MQPHNSRTTESEGEVVAVASLGRTVSVQECWLAKLYSFNAPFRSANRSQIQALVGLTFLPLLADLPDALPLQVLGAYLGVDHDPLVLEQHYDV